MHYRLLAILSLLSAGSIISCGGGGGGSSPAKPVPVSVNSDGTCTERLIADLNSYIGACSALFKNESTENLNQFASVCSSFISTHASSVTCRASSMVPNSSDAAVKRCLGFGQYETVPSGAVEFKLEGIHKICGAVVEIANKEKQKNQGSHVASSAVNPEVPNEKKAKEIPTESKKFWLGGVKAGGLKITKGANKEVNHFYPEGPYTEAKGRYYTLFISTQNGYFHLGISGINFKNSYCTIQLRSEKISSPISDIIVPGTTWKLELLSYETWEDSDTETVAMHWTAPQKTMDLSCSLKDGFTTTDHLKLINEILKPILEISRK